MTVVRHWPILSLPVIIFPQQCMARVPIIAKLAMGAQEYKSQAKFLPGRYLNPGPLNRQSRMITITPQRLGGNCGKCVRSRLTMIKPNTVHMCIYAYIEDAALINFVVYITPHSN